VLSTPPPDEPAPARDLRGRLFEDLDQLAFALELEAAAFLREGRETAAVRRQELRLGVRLAQRLVAGIHAEEVHGRLTSCADAYEARLGGGPP
jgi:hypothetical protein